MGYVHDVTMTHKIPLETMKQSAGTWAIAATSNVWSLNKTAAADTTVNHIPIELPQDIDPAKGCKLVSVDLWYTVGTADATDNTMVLQKTTLPADNVAVPTVTTPAVTYDAAHNTSALRKANRANMHKMTITLTTPLWMNGADEYYVENTVDCSGAATSVVKIYAARANFTLRL